MLSTTSISLIVMGCAFVVALVYFLYTIIVLKKKIAAQKGCLEAEKETLKSELSKTLENKDAQIQILNDNISSLKNEIKAAESERKELGASIQEKESLFRNLQEENSRLLQEKNQNEERIDAILSSDKAEVLKEFQKIQEKNAKLKELNDVLENKIKTLDADIRRSESNISSLTTELKVSQEESCKNAAEFDRVSGELEKLKTTNIELTNNLEKTKKENKALKDENDDLENDKEDLEKKIKKHKDEISSLRDDLDSSRKKEKEKSERIGELSEELNGTKANLSNKQNALTFVQEVLSAKENPDNTTKEQRKVINRINSFMNDSLFDLMRASGPSDRTAVEIENLKNEFDVWQNLEKKHWLRNKRTIAFVGEFSAGKTSIVNSILKQNDPDAILLPESVKATTAIPTYISNTLGRSSFVFLTPNNQLKTMSESTFKMVDKDVLDNVKGTSSLIKYFVMSYQNKALSDLSILDTPGFDSNDSEDTVRTIEVINECDALFWVIDVNKGELNKTSIKTIKENLHRPLFIVINKVDTVNPKGVEEAEKKIRKTLDDCGVAYERIIRFSKKENTSLILKHLNSVNKARVEVNAIESIENVIKTYRQNVQLNVKLCKNKLAEVKKLGSSISANFMQTVNNLAKNCDQVAGIPHEETRWLGIADNVYEMSLIQYSEFKKKLDAIKTIGNQSKKLSDKRMDIEKNIVMAVDDYQKTVQLEIKWDDLNDTFTKIVASFNSAIANS